eukprot:gene29755-51791_t
MTDLPVIGVPVQSKALSGLDSLLQRGVEEGVFPLARLEVFHRGEHVLSTGNASKDCVFDLASVTKVITATAVMQLVDEGRADLDAPVAPHLDFALANPRHPEAPITLRQLLNHTSSLSDALYYDVDVRVPGRDATQPLAGLLADFLAPGGRHYSAEKSFSDAVPGTAWDYCNLGYAVLGQAASRIAGEDLRERSRRTIFAPLGLRNTSWTLAGTPAALR